MWRSHYWGTWGRSKQEDHGRGRKQKDEGCREEIEEDKKVWRRLVERKLTAEEIKSKNLRNVTKIILGKKASNKMLDECNDKDNDKSSEEDNELDFEEEWEEEKKWVKRRLEGRKQESRSMGDGEMFATFKMWN